MTGHGDGAGGIQLQASVNNMQMTNNVLENNGGVFAGGIGAWPAVRARQPQLQRADRQRPASIGNGGLTTSGGVGIFYGSNNYEVANNIICSNFSVEYGAGLSHIGLSPGGKIHDNKIYYNEAVDSRRRDRDRVRAAGRRRALGDGSGSVNVDRNLIQSNTSTLGRRWRHLRARRPRPADQHPQQHDRGQPGRGSGRRRSCSTTRHGRRIINNTIANNVTTGSSESRQIGVPHGGRPDQRGERTAWQTDARYAAQYPNAATRPDFSNPQALFNNIFWNNDAMTLNQFGPGATLVDQGFIDFEIHGTTNNDDTFTPRYSDLTNGQILGPNGVQHAGAGRARQPDRRRPGLRRHRSSLELTVAGSRLDPQQAAVTITGQDPPVGLDRRLPPDRRVDWCHRPRGALLRHRSRLRSPL